MKKEQQTNRANYLQNAIFGLSLFLKPAPKKSSRLKHRVLNDQGYILLPVLIVSGLLACLMLTRLQTLLLYTKTHAERRHYHHAFYEAESLLLNWVHQHSVPPSSCFKPELGANDKRPKRETLRIL